MLQILSRSYIIILLYDLRGPIPQSFYKHSWSSVTIFIKKWLHNHSITIITILLSNWDFFNAVRKWQFLCLFFPMAYIVWYSFYTAYCKNKFVDYLSAHEHFEAHEHISKHITWLIVTNILSTETASNYFKAFFECLQMPPEIFYWCL